MYSELVTPYKVKYSPWHASQHTSLCSCGMLLIERWSPTEKDARITVMGIRIDPVVNAFLRDANGLRYQMRGVVDDFGNFVEVSK